MIHGKEGASKKSMPPLADNVYCFLIPEMEQSSLGLEASAIDAVFDRNDLGHLAELRQLLTYTSAAVKLDGEYNAYRGPTSELHNQADL